MLDASIVSKNSLSHSFIQSTYQFKILILGEAGVGKTSLKVRYTDNKFLPNTKASTAIDFKIKLIHLTESETAKLSIWDTAGSERYRSIANSYLKNAQAILLCFDISDKTSFDELGLFWQSFIKEYFSLGKEQNKICLVYLVGTKQDLEQQRAVSKEEALTFIKQFENGEYFETSSLTGYNVEEVFQELTLKLIDLHEQNKLQYNEPTNRGVHLSEASSSGYEESYYSKYSYAEHQSHSSGSFCC